MINELYYVHVIRITNNHINGEYFQNGIGT